ncbi:hypothetical protein U14_00952 [Candidatus Moduliflexus flocculans]|uniref:ABC transporter substrate-binding protein n=1 Tax=Candidatus Moduliflexus flocculans TaxID=1499966 RepID=A0A0S6VRB1_9BACT|nr:hypothetical protein U14_00952 [Candidatus Moduliflexus flocculans]
MKKSLMLFLMTMLFAGAFQASAQEKTLTIWSH